MMQYTAKDLLQLQADLIDTKVDMAASKTIDKAIDRVIVQLDTLKSEVHDINIRLAKVETKIDILHLDYQDKSDTQKELQKDMQKEIKRKFIEYTFKAGWALVTCTVSIIASIAFFYLHSH